MDRGAGSPRPRAPDLCQGPIEHGQCLRLSHSLQSLAMWRNMPCECNNNIRVARSKPPLLVPRSPLNSTSLRLWASGHQGTCKTFVDSAGPFAIPDMLQADSSEKCKARVLNQQLNCRRDGFVPEAPDLKQTLPRNLRQQKLRIWRPLDPASGPSFCKRTLAKLSTRRRTAIICFGSLFVHRLLVQGRQYNLQYWTPGLCFVKIPKLRSA